MTVFYLVHEKWRRSQVATSHALAAQARNTRSAVAELPAYETYDEPEVYEIYEGSGYECPYPFEESYEFDFIPGTY